MNSTVMSITAGGSHNWGDALLAHVAKQLLSDATGCEVVTHQLAPPILRPGLGRATPSHQQPGGSTRALLRKMVSTWLQRKVRSKLAASQLPLHTNLIVIGGGQLLLPKYLHYVYQWIRRAERKSIPVVLLGVGGEGVYRRDDRRKILAIANAAAKIYVRDPCTREILRQSDFMGEVEIVPDIAYALRDCFPAPIEQRSVTVLVPAGFDSVQKYGYSERQMREYLDWWVLEASRAQQFGEKIEIIGSTASDCSFAESIRTACIQSGIAIKVCRVQDLEEFLWRIGSARRVVSARMHPLIIAQQFGRTVVPFIRNRKLRDFWNLRQQSGYDPKLRDAVRSVVAITASVAQLQPCLL